MTNTQNLEIDLSDFLSFFPQRCPGIMWFLGAGASVNAGLPTASTLTWEFKRALYCNAHQISINRFPDFTSQPFRSLIQDFFDGQGSHPSLGDPAEYSSYFERYLPNEEDRRRFLQRRMSDVNPSYGYFCLAALVALGKIELVWTTNFDSLIERAASVDIFKSELPDGLVTVTLECPEKLDAISRDNHFPALVKLHGDYKFRKLKNTTSELQRQDEVLQKWLREHCGRRGLAVIGYSGRDDSIMDCLESALTLADPFPQGLFWFVQAGQLPNQRVLDLLSQASELGCHAGYIEVGGFDELMHLLNLDYQYDNPQISGLLKSHRGRRQPITIARNGKSWPVVRTNALEILEFPSTCTIFQASIGGSREVRAVADAFEKPISVARRRKGVIAIGSRRELERAFENYEPHGFDTHAIDPKRFYQDSAELGIFYDTICHALASATSLRRSSVYRGRLLYVSNPNVFSEAESRRLRQLGINAVREARPGGPTIHEALRIGLDYRDERLWLLLEPTLFVTHDGERPYLESDRHDIGREDKARRYNRQLNDLLEFWIEFLVSRCGSPLQLHYPTKEESQAVFSVGTTSAYSAHI